MKKIFCLFITFYFLIISSCISIQFNKEGIPIHAVFFDGDSGYIEIPYSDSLNIKIDITIEAWFNVDFNNSNPNNFIYTNLFPIISQPTESSAIGNYLLAVTKESIIFGYEPITIGDIRINFPVAVKDGWHHIAVTHTFKNGEYTRLYYDGVKIDGQWEGNGNEMVIDNLKKPYLIGLLGINDRKDTSYYKGMISEIRIWDIIRTEEELNKNKSIELKGNENGLIAYWKFIEPTNSRIITDYSKKGNNGKLIFGSKLVETY
jgi:hypothetical protein